MEFILNLLYVYIAVFTVYYLVLAIRNLNTSKFRIEKRYNQFDDKNNFAIIIYSHNNRETLKSLINMIKLQEYPINKLRAIAILDNCNDNSEDLFIGENFVNVVKFDEFQGKDKAVSILLEQMKNDEWINSFIFLDANRSISNDFLINVNAGLAKHNVLIGDTLMINEHLDIIEKIKAVYLKYQMNFIRQARTLLGLAIQIDSGALIMKKSVIDKVGSVDFEDIDSELRFSVLLSKIGEKCAFNPNIQTFVQSEAYVFNRPRLSKRLKLFANCIKEIRFKNFAFTEHVLSLISPNFWLLVIAYLGLIKHSYKYYFFVDVKIVAFSFIVLALAYSISLINAKLNMKEIVLLCLYPVYTICHIVKNFPLTRMLLEKIYNDNSENENEKLSVDVVVTTPKCDLPCKLELISHKGTFKVRFLYKNKKYTTGRHLRMIDALQELKTELDDRGFILRICSCCSFYKSSFDNEDNMLKGFCMSDYPSPYLKTPKPTVVWNTCPKFSPAKLNSFIEEMVALGNEEK